MSVEVHVSAKALAVRFNGSFSPTERGHFAHELVGLHRLLKSNKDPKVQFSMSEEFERTCRERENELCVKLGLSSDPRIREKAIQGLDGHLRQVGLPYYIKI